MKSKVLSDIKRRRKLQQQQTIEELIDAPSVSSNIFEELS